MRQANGIAKLIARSLVMLAALSAVASAEVVSYTPAALQSARESSPFVAVHLLRAEAVSELPQFSQSIANEGAEAAGVRHIVIIPVQNTALSAFGNAPFLAMSDPDNAAREKLGAREADLPVSLIFAKGQQRPIERTFERGGRATPNIRALNARLFRAWRHPALDRFPLENGIAIGGMDAVSYHRSNGPVAGIASITSEYRGISYRFATAENRRQFVADPQRYLPAAGGWCAQAMSGGEQVEADIRTFVIYEGRLHLFYNGIFGDSTEGFQEDPAGAARKAATNWRRIAEPDSDARDPQR